MSVVASRRLDLTPMTVEALEALIARDPAALEAVTGVRFRRPLESPPLTEDVLPHFRDVLRDDPAIAALVGAADRAPGDARGRRFDRLHRAA